MCLVLCLVSVIFFFCKQKTAYELRISDWSSDVCSSDLYGRRGLSFHCNADCQAVWLHAYSSWLMVQGKRPWSGQSPSLHCSPLSVARGSPRPPVFQSSRPPSGPPSSRRAALRSEEHTSELQSLMRISYAVFCLKKKNNKTNHIHSDQCTREHYKTQQYKT